MIFKATFDGKVLVPEKPIDLAPGAVVELEMSIPAQAEAAPTLLQRLAKIAEEFPDDPDSPRDLAEQHDHYLYGTPKKPSSFPADP